MQQTGDCLERRVADWEGLKAETGIQKSNSEHYNYDHALQEDIEHTCSEIKKHHAIR